MGKFDGCWFSDREWAWAYILGKYAFGGDVLAGVRYVQEAGSP